ncbi:MULTISPECIES: TraM recognition domain-containing protein [unclassified Nonomuraea]|uniref:type IV secretory system conjugative DNA transfer family protein n=1 Tax=unclassified Nonomuraea TaxID=2593643 RepID=UPI0033E568AF
MPHTGIRPMPAAAAMDGWQLLTRHGMLVAIAAGLLGFVLAFLVLRDRLRDPRRRQGLALWWRLRWRLYPGKGFARRLELWRHYGLPAARKVAQQARPSLRGWWTRYLVRHSEVAVFLGWAQGWIFRFRTYAAFEDNLLVLAPQKEGKTAHLAGRIIDAPGAVIATSIRDDIVTLTAGLRAQRGRVHLFNPERVGEYASTLRWSPVDGCEDQATAIRRAAHMVAATQTGGLSDEGFWTSQAAMVLAALLHAAALERLTLERVYAWALDEDQAPLKILDRQGRGTDRAAALVRRYHALHVRTRDSIFLTLRQALRCMEDPATAWAVCPKPGQGLDLEEVLRRRETLYMIAGEDAHPAIPVLFTTLVAEIHHQARQLASQRPSRRMDPPTMIVLDEAPEICPITQLPGWLATAAGSGLFFIVAGQSHSQFRQRWGAEGAKTIWNNTKAKLLAGATSDPDDLEVMSKLCGEIALPYWEESVDGSGKRQRTRRWETVPVLPPEQARRLPTGRALVLRRNATPTIVRMEQVWRRADYRRWRAKDGTVPLPRHPTATPTPLTLPEPEPTRRSWPRLPRGRSDQERAARPWHIASAETEGDQ